MEEPRRARRLARCYERDRLVVTQHEADEIAARLTRDTEARVPASRTLIDAAKQTLTRTPVSGVRGRSD